MTCKFWFRTKISRISPPKSSFLFVFNRGIFIKPVYHFQTELPHVLATLLFFRTVCPTFFNRWPRFPVSHLEQIRTDRVWMRKLGVSSIKYFSLSPSLFSATRVFSNNVPPNFLPLAVYCFIHPFWWQMQKAFLLILWTYISRYYNVIVGPTMAMSVLNYCTNISSDLRSIH